MLTCTSPTKQLSMVVLFKVELGQVQNGHLHRRYRNSLNIHENQSRGMQKVYRLHPFAILLLNLFHKFYYPFSYSLLLEVLSNNSCNFNWHRVQHSKLYLIQHVHICSHTHTHTHTHTYTHAHTRAHTHVAASIVQSRVPRVPW